MGGTTGRGRIDGSRTRRWVAGEAAGARQGHGEGTTRARTAGTRRGHGEGTTYDTVAAAARAWAGVGAAVSRRRGWVAAGQRGRGGDLRQRDCERVRE
jgi:hypothetical protein